MQAEFGGFDVDTIETTGAGDTFCGSALNFILEHDINALTENDLKELLAFANAAAALSVQKLGAQGGMPYLHEVEEMLK